MVGIKVSEQKRREGILRAAYDVAARQGLEAVTLRAVAARADVSHGTVLFHFKLKHELVSGLLDRVMYATAVLRIPGRADHAAGGTNARAAARRDGPSLHRSAALSSLSRLLDVRRAKRLDPATRSSGAGGVPQRVQGSGRGGDHGRRKSIV